MSKESLKDLREKILDRVYESHLVTNAGRLSFFMSGADRVQMLHQSMENVVNIDSWYPDLWNK
jgi:hypothetical protein